MKNFINEDFILENDIAKGLYNKYSKDLPIIDFHNHLSPKEIAEDRQFENMTQIWLAGDHYKWRLMRANGIDEKYITGEGSDEEKFMAFARTMEIAYRSPIYHWVQMELKFIFGIEELLTEKSAPAIYKKCNEMLNTPEFSTRGVLKKWGVESMCTTDDPIDTLEYHIKANADDFGIKILPTWRPDKAIKIELGQDFITYVKKLSEVSETDINKFSDFLSAIKIRQKFFIENGCVVSDHGIDVFFAEDYTKAEIEDIFTKGLNGQTLTKVEVLKFKSAMMYELAVMNHEAGWVQQMHYGPIRNNNDRMYKVLGPDTGFDSMGDENVALSMAKFFNRLDTEGKLTKTVVYNINPKDNDMVATMIGNYQDGSVFGKMQFGSAWWFCDTKSGMEAQLDALSNHGLLATFIGMLTDSRSILSFARHDYFRRILCNMFGKDMEKGLVPMETETVGKIISNISYYNSKKYFEL
jgi:glucuronate isomerase